MPRVKPKLKIVELDNSKLPERRYLNAKLAGALDNSITRDLRQAIIDAAAAHGADGRGAGGLTGYLYMLAAENQKTFSGLLTKLLPMQINSSKTDQTIKTVHIVSVPVDHYLTPDDMRKLNSGFGPADIKPDDSSGATIEHESADIKPDDIGAIDSSES